MPEGVSEVQKLPLPAVKFVCVHNVALHLHARRDDLLQRSAGGDLLELLKQLPAAEHAVFDDLRAAVEENFARKRRERVKIAQHEIGLVEAACEIFARREVHSGLAADGGIHRREQRRRKLHEVNAAQIGRGGKAAHIAGHAAAERDQTVCARDAAFGEKIQDFRVFQKVFGAFSVRENVGHDAHPRLLQRGADARAIKPEHAVVRDDGGAGAACARGDAFARLRKKPAADQHVIAP